MLTNSEYLDTDESSDNYCNTSTMLKNISDISNNKLIENNTLDDSSQLNQTQYKHILNLVNENAEINTQDEELVSKVVKKNLKHILFLNKEEIEINTQQFMDLNVSRIAQQLKETVPNVSKIETDSNDSAISIPFITKKLKSPDQNNENGLTLNKPKEPKKDNNEFCSGNLVSSNQDLDSNLLNQSQDPEIIIFRSMCDTMMNIIAINNDDNHSINMINYQINHLVMKQVNADVITYIDYKKVVPNLNNNEQHLGISESIAIKKRQYDILINDSSDESSSQYCKQLSQNKKLKFTSQNMLNIQFKSHSNTIGQCNASKKNVIVESDNNDCIVVENTMKNHNQKRINVNILQQNKCLRELEIEPIYYCSPDGMIHKDMLNYINSFRYLKKY